MMNPKRFWKTHARVDSIHEGVLVGTSIVLPKERVPRRRHRSLQVVVDFRRYPIRVYRPPIGDWTNYEQAELETTPWNVIYRRGVFELTSLKSL